MVAPSLSEERSRPSRCRLPESSSSFKLFSRDGGKRSRLCELTEAAPGARVTGSAAAAASRDTASAPACPPSPATHSRLAGREPLSFACGGDHATEGRKGVLMIDRLRQSLTYSNVTATVALFIAVGGTSYAAVHLTGRDIRNGSLTGHDIKRNSLGGNSIKESRLGPVRRALNAARLDGLTAERLLVRCPKRTVAVSDVCVERASRTPAPYTIAAGTCEGVDRFRALGRRLPSHDELMTAIGDDGIALAPGGELTRDVYPSAAAPGRVDVLYITDDVGSVALTPNTVAGAKAFRCVADPIN
jgi:hypothetical protein